MRTALFVSPINASNYIRGAGEVKGVQIRSINYETGVARVSLVNADDTVRTEVNGVDVPSPETAEDADIAAAVRATIAATLP